MAQGMFGGFTSYEIQSLQDILEDIEQWIELTNEKEELITTQYRKLKNCGYWNKIPFNFQSTVQQQFTILIQ